MLMRFFAGCDTVIRCTGRGNSDFSKALLRVGLSKRRTCFKNLVKRKPRHVHSCFQNSRQIHSKWRFMQSMYYTIIVYLNGRIWLTKIQILCLNFLKRVEDLDLTNPPRILNFKIFEFETTSKFIEF